MKHEKRLKHEMMNNMMANNMSQITFKTVCLSLDVKIVQNKNK